MSSSGGTSPAGSAGGASRHRPARRVQARQLIAGAGLALVIIFAVLNTNKVQVDWIVTTTQTPLIVVIVVSFLLGAVGGALLWRRRTS